MKDEKRTESTTTGSRALSAGRYVVSGVALLLLLALVAPFVVYGFPGVIGADASFVVLSGSMEPDIRAGDAVVVDSVRPAQIAVGDVITFTRDGSSSPITHRVLEATGEGAERSFVTKGDSNEEADAQPVPAANVIGRVVVTIPYIGLVVDFANTQPGFLLFVALPIGLLILNEVYTFVRKPAADEEQPADAPDAVLAAPADADADEETEAVFQFTRADLTFTMIALGGLAAYAAYVAVLVDTSAVPVALLVAALGVLALTAAIRYGAPGPDEALAIADGGVALTRENRIVAGSKPGAVEEYPTVDVDSLTDLVTMAQDDRAWIVHDADAGHLYFVGDGTVFTHAVDAEAVENSSDEGETAEQTAAETAPDEWETLSPPGDERHDAPDTAAADEGER